MASSQWTNITDKALAKFRAAQLPEEQQDLAIRQGLFGTCYRLIGRSVRTVKVLSANAFIYLVHISTQVANKPLVDIGRQYSVSELNARIEQLEEALIKQWTGLKDADMLSAQEEVRLYVAACHVVRQYDRVTLELLMQRLNIGAARAILLMGRLQEDQVITEGYDVTYHDVMRQAAEVIMERELNALDKQAASTDIPKPPAKSH
jgi:hypothetical protein